MPTLNLRSPFQTGLLAPLPIQPASLPDTALAASNISDLLPCGFRNPQQIRPIAYAVVALWQNLSVSIGRLICVL